MPTTAVSKNSESSFTRNERFISATTRISEMAAAEGLTIIPFASPQLVHFSVLSDREQKQTLRLLEALADVCAELQTRGDKIRSVKSLTWAFLKHFQCTAPSNLITFLEDGDLVNAYGTEHRLLYASFSFFEIFSYSLEDFYCRSWMDLFERDDLLAHEALVVLADEVLDGEHPSVSPMTMIPPHRCNERSSLRKVATWLQGLYCAPIYYHGDIIGYLGTFKCQVIHNQLAASFNLTV